MGIAMYIIIMGVCRWQNEEVVDKKPPYLGGSYIVPLT